MSRPVTLTVRVSTDDIAGIREWLRQIDGKAPRRPEAILWQYIATHLLSDAEQDSVNVSLCVEPPEARP